MQQKQTQRLLDRQADLQSKQLDLIKQQIEMAKAGDVWTYQGITAATEPYVYDEQYDPSPEAEARRIAERDHFLDEQEEELNADERAALDDIFG